MENFLMRPRSFGSMILTIRSRLSLSNKQMLRASYLLTRPPSTHIFVVVLHLPPWLLDHIDPIVSHIHQNVSWTQITPSAQICQSGLVLQTPSHQKKIIDSESDSDENNNDYVDDGNGEGAATNTEDAVIDTDVDSEMVITDFEAVEEAYAATKAMGDTDREVHLISPWLWTRVFINIPFIYDLGACKPPKVRPYRRYQDHLQAW